MDLIPLLGCLFATHHLKLLILGLFCSCRRQDLLSKGIQKPAALRPHYRCNHLPIQPAAVVPSAGGAAARVSSFYVPFEVENEIVATLIKIKIFFSLEGRGKHDQ